MFHHRLHLTSWQLISLYLFPAIYQRQRSLSIHFFGIYLLLPLCHITPAGDYDTDEETDKLLKKHYVSEPNVDLTAETHQLASQAMKNRAKEGKCRVGPSLLFRHCCQLIV